MSTLAVAAQTARIVMERDGCVRPTINTGSEINRHKPMGFLNFLSSPPELEEKYKSSLSAHLREDENILNKLARIQSKISEKLTADEEVRLISYHKFDFADQGFVIVTNKRILYFNKSLGGKT